MSNITLKGHAEDSTVSLTVCTLAVLNNDPSLKRITVAIRKPDLPISGKYSPSTRTASVKVLQSEFNTLVEAVANQGQIYFEYTYDSATFNVVAFGFQPCARVNAVPSSGVTIAASSTDAADKAAVNG